MDVRGSDTGRHLGVALSEKREQFARLIGQEVSNSAACRLVGVNRKTGTRWRFGRTIANTAGEPVHYPPVRILNATARSVRYLSLSERTTIADLHRDGFSVRATARELRRAPSTISRELHLNSDDAGRYRPHTAQAKVRARMPRPRFRALVTDAVLGAAVCEPLARKWSPEHVAHELTFRFPDRPARHLCAESIYQAIYDPDTALTRPAKHALRTGRRRRRPRTQSLPGVGGWSG